jgi:DNA-binding PadR family transcriptional regulator
MSKEKESVMVRYVTLTEKGREVLKYVDEMLERIGKIIEK